MKKLIFVFLLFSVIVKGQTTYKTFYGYDISPKDTIHALSIFINIVFDQCSACDPLYYIPTPNWPAGPPNTVNTSPPVYLANFMDRNFNPNNIQGTFTKRFAEASFNNFIVVGDFINVNIAESKISPSIVDTFFSEQLMLDSVIALINQNGGLQTHYGHNTISYYDGYINSGDHFLVKNPASPNGNFDLVQFFTRNTTNYFGGVEGGGYGSAVLTKELLVNGVPCSYDKTTIQVIGNSDLSNPDQTPTEIHELGHHLFGMTNSAHYGGGSPLNEGDLVTLSANSGWGIMCGSHSCMVSDNGYERWRLDWRGPDNDDYPIAANNQESDIEKADGPKSFTLRDFVTYGDAIRIKLPYVDEGALNQYIWLENHRIHQNGKEDYPSYWTASCKDDGIPGIFAYYQVGKDVREGSWDDMLPSLTDHLIPICADGRWDVRRLAETMDACMYGSDNTNVQEYYQPNPLCGYNDLHRNHFFNTDVTNTLNWVNNGITEKIIKKKDGITTNNLHSLGDDGDPFSSERQFLISIRSNPAPVNVVTYHHTRPDKTGVINKSTRIIDNRKIHLSGLSILAGYDEGNYNVYIRVC